MTKIELDQIYARPEKFPFERIIALMSFAQDEMKQLSEEIELSRPLPEDYEKEMPELKQDLP